MNHRARPVGVRHPARLRRRQLRVAHDALDRRDRRPLRRLPPRRPHVGHRPTPTTCGATPYNNMVASFERPVGRRPLHRRQPRARRAHLPRRLEPVPEPRRQQPAVQPLAAVVRQGLRRDHRRRQRLLPDHGASGARRSSASRRDEPTSAPMRRERHARSPRRQVPPRPIDKWEAQVRHEAGRAAQPPPLQGHRRRHRPGRRRRPPPRSASSATTSRRSPSTTARAGRTRSPPRAASTPPRTTGATATAIFRLFYDTVKGGDYRAREGNVYRLAEVSRRHHRPVRRPGRARSPASTAACSTTAASAAPR